MGGIKRSEIENMFFDDQQGYLFADLKRIISNGCDEEITKDHIEALMAENRASLAHKDITQENSYAFSG